MSVFGDIMSKIFRHPQAKAAPRPAPQAAPAAAAPSPAPAAAQAAAEAPAVDVGAVLEVMAKDNGQQLNWRQSIVDLLKLLSIDSSLANRKALAAGGGGGRPAVPRPPPSPYLSGLVIGVPSRRGGGLHAPARAWAT